VTIEGRLARAGFTLTRDYPVPLERVWDAFAKEDQKLDWFSAGTPLSPASGRSTSASADATSPRATFPDGPVPLYEATYTDIVEHVRTVTTYGRWLDGVHVSMAVASFEFEPIDEGTRFTQVEYGVFFDQFCAYGPNREKGSRGLLEAMGDYLA